MESDPGRRHWGSFLTHTCQYHSMGHTPKLTIDIVTSYGQSWIGLSDLSTAKLVFNLWCAHKGEPSEKRGFSSHKRQLRTMEETRKKASQGGNVASFNSNRWRLSLAPFLSFLDMHTTALSVCLSVCYHWCVVLNFFAILFSFLSIFLLFFVQLSSRLHTTKVPL